MTTDAFAPLHTYIDFARWFGGKGRPWSVAGTRRLGELPGAAEGLRVVIDLVEVSYDDAVGGVEHYQLPLACYVEPQERLAHALVGQWEDAELGQVHAYDALHDREAMQLWLHAFAGGSEGTTVDGLPAGGRSRNCT